MSFGVIIRNKSLICIVDGRMFYWSTGRYLGISFEEICIYKFEMYVHGRWVVEVKSCFLVFVPHSKYSLVLEMWCCAMARYRQGHHSKQQQKQSSTFWQFQLVQDSSSLISASYYAWQSSPDAPSIKHLFPCKRYNKRGRFLPSVIEALYIHSFWISGCILKQTFELVRGGTHGSCSPAYWLSTVMSHECHGV